MEGKKAKITVEIEGEEKQVYETNLFTLLVNQGNMTVFSGLAEGVSYAQMGDHIAAIEQALKTRKEKYPEAVSLLEEYKKVKAKKEDSTKARKACGEV